MFGRLILLVVVTLSISILHYRRYRDKKKIAISIALWIYALAVGYSGYILMRTVPPLLLLHLLSVTLLYLSTFYYLFRDKLSPYIITAPLLTMLIYLGLEYLSGSRYEV